MKVHYFLPVLTSQAFSQIYSTDTNGDMTYFNVHDNKQHMIFLTDKKTKAEAEAICGNVEIQGQGYVIDIENEAEYMKVNIFLQDYGGQDDVDTYWMGAWKNQEGNKKFYNQQRNPLYPDQDPPAPIEVPYFNWADGQPQNSNVRLCLVLKKGDDGNYYMHTSECDHQYHYICSYPGPGATTPPSTTTTAPTNYFDVCAANPVPGFLWDDPSCTNVGGDDTSPWPLGSHVSPGVTLLKFNNKASCYEVYPCWCVKCNKKALLRGGETLVCNEGTEVLYHNDLGNDDNSCSSVEWFRNYQPWKDVHGGSYSWRQLDGTIGQYVVDP
jgi:hypothetical protein